MDSDVSDHLVELNEKTVNVRWQYIVAADDSVETYNTAGKLLSLTDRSGRSQFLTYDLSVAEGGDGDPETLDRPLMIWAVSLPQLRCAKTHCHSNRSAVDLSVQL